MASFCVSAACAATSAARERFTVSWNLERSSSTITWPLVTWSFTSTSTRFTVPDSSLPTATERVGLSVPLAVTVSVMSPRSTGVVT